MATAAVLVSGIVRDGVVVPETDTRLPEGAHVEIILRSEAIPPDLQAELAAWDRAGDEAWALMDAWEKEEAHGTG